MSAAQFQTSRSSRHKEVHFNSGRSKLIRASLRRLLQSGLVLSLSCFSWGADTNTEPKLDGVWKWTFTMPDGTSASPKARLKREGDTLTGTSIPRPGMAIPISDGKIDG